MAPATRSTPGTVTRPSSGAPPTAGRLPSRPTGRRERQREVRRGLLATLGLLAVLIGVPAALVISVGNPITSAPSREWLTAQVSATTIIAVLGCALWIAWAHFAVCVLTEFRAARRGAGAPGDVPLGGGSQVLARRLVAAALLLAGAAAMVPAGAAAPATSAPMSSSSITQSADAAPTAAVITPVAEVATAEVVAGPLKTYVVQPPDGRRYDSLWDIAERTLGDPLRYKEVFELNRDRVQDDGRKLLDANLIHPGWVLQMPTDATGEGVSTPALAPPVRQAPVEAPVAPAPPGTPMASTTATEVAAPAGVVTPGLSTERMLLGGGLLAAGLLVALSARRGPYGRPEAAGVEEQLRLAATPVRADLLDRALRQLASACADSGSPLPEIAVAYCDDTHLTLSLIGSAGAPPAPWTTVSDGRGWVVAAADLGAEVVDMPAPYPALAGVAVSPDGTDVLVDLEAAPGLVALEGDVQMAREIATSLAFELSTNLWSDGVQVTVVGFGDDLAAAAPASVTVVDRLDEVLDDLERESRHAAEALKALGVQGVLSGRLVRGAARRRPRVVVLSGAPSGPEAARLQALVADVRTPLAVLCVGTTTAARWRFAVDGEGVLDLGVLGVRAKARRLPREAYLPLLDLLRGSDDDRAQTATSIASLSPRAALEEVTGAGRGSASGGPASALPVVAPTGVPGVQVRLLGAVDVVAAGPVELSARPLLTDVVVAAALHREGLHEAVLRSEVWPRGVSDDVLAATVAQVQVWLGTGPDGRPRFGKDGQGRYVLASDVHSDWDVLQAAAAAATGPTEQAVLEHGLAGIRGEAFTGLTVGRGGSLVFHRHARDARVVGTAVARRAAGLAAGKGDREAAARDLHAGLALVPTAEALWRDLLRLVAGDPVASAEVAQLALEALAARGVRAEPETDALIQSLAPGLAVNTA